MLEIKKLDNKTILIISDTKENMFEYIERFLLLSFYESEKNKTFTIKPSLDKLKEWYKNNVSKNKVHIKDDNWVAFAIPRIDFFTKKQLKDKSKKDDKIINLLKLLDTFFKTRNYMILFVNKEYDPITYAHHEMAHVLWAYNKEYKADMQEAIRAMNKKIKKKFYDALLSIGYSEADIADELQAYLATGPMHFQKIHGIKKYHLIFKKIINKYFSRKKLIQVIK